jgi:hypothetical protein
MKKEKGEAVADRRSFLKLAGAGAVLGSTTVATGGPAQAATEPADDGQGRYRETEHVRRVYDLARF